MSVILVQHRAELVFMGTKWLMHLILITYLYFCTMIILNTYNIRMKYTYSIFVILVYIFWKNYTRRIVHTCVCGTVIRWLKKDGCHKKKSHTIFNFLVFNYMNSLFRNQIFWTPIYIICLIKKNYTSPKIMY